MSFAETRFPDAIAYGSVGGPLYATDVIVLHNGYEQRNAQWSTSRARYNIVHGVKTQSQLDALLAFFRARRGRAQGFRFKDWTDYTAIGQGIGTGDNSATQFQLIKTYTSGSDTEIRTITKPVSGTISIYLDAVLQSSGVSVDTATGIVTFDSAPGSSVAITADFEFDVPVRFDTDWLSAALDADGIYSWDDVPLVEIRV